MLIGVLVSPEVKLSAARFFSQLVSDRPETSLVQIVQTTAV